MISIKNVSKKLGDFCLDDVTLDINDGEYMIILGPTGAGKTILLETIAGIYPPDRGEIYLDDRNITRLPPRERNIGMVYQDYMLFPHMTVEKNIKFGISSRNIDREKAAKKVKELAELLGISHLMNRYPGTLSGGEQQRVAIARALIIKPKVLLLDEPLSALDAETRSRLREELQRIHSLTNTTMVHVTHSFDEAFLLGNQMAIMNNGNIVQSGEPGDVFRKPNCKFAADFLGASNVFRGVSVTQNGISYINIHGIRIASATKRIGDVYLSVRPEDILISLKPLESSARNSFTGKIEDISNTGIVVRVKVDIGIPFVSAITRRSCVDMALRKDMKVYLTFKAVDVHIF
jgi:molybdate transport system ATP-binding protein/molybdate/tungstate transport system ATP-binding protein